MFGNTKLSNKERLIAESRSKLSIFTKTVKDLKSVNTELNAELTVQIKIRDQAIKDADELNNEVIGNISIIDKINNILS